VRNLSHNIEQEPLGILSIAENVHLPKKQRVSFSEYNSNFKHFKKKQNQPLYTTKNITYNNQGNKNNAYNTSDIKAVHVNKKQRQNISLIVSTDKVA